MQFVSFLLTFGFIPNMTTNLRNHFMTCGFILATALVSGQTKASLFETFDKNIQPKNAAYNNGKIHFNTFRSADNTFRYYKSADYLSGNILYDGQVYGNISLKYDLFADELIIKFEGENNQMGFNVVKAKVDAFYVDGKKFVNLDLVSHPDFISGFYEETDAGKIKLYTKFAKDKFDVLANDKITYTFNDRTAFALKNGNDWLPINSQRDVTKAFPMHEKAISDFFRENISLERSDRKQFMKKLATYLVQLLNTDTK